MLTNAEYKEIVENKRTLQLRIDQADIDDDYYDDLKKAAKARKDQLDLQIELYANFLKDAIEEYEAAHPPEPPPA